MPAAEPIAPGPCAPLPLSPVDRTHYRRNHDRSVMSLKQLIITRFSYRGRRSFKHLSGPSFRSKEDPLDPKRLGVRFMLFALTCLPSVLGQIDQDFAWILLV